MRAWHGDAMELVMPWWLWLVLGLALVGLEVLTPGG
jgi:membrane protein implicated in regulation of membrane protease activity